MKKIAFLCLLLLGGILSAQEVTLNAEGYGKEKNALVPVTIKWSDSWFEPFKEPAYSHSIARAAAVLCNLSYDAHSKGPKNTLVQAYQKFGVLFDDIEWHYDIDYTDKTYGINQAAFSLSHKKLPSGRDLVFVLIRGTPGNEEEWLSNINICDSYKKNKNAKDSDYHEGFYTAVSQISTCLEQFAAKHEINLKTSSILITGHSRGAASSNLLAALLADREVISTDRAFVYTFATPNVTTRADAHDPKYNFIFNIINGEDIVPTVPPNAKKWTFTKFGVTRAIVNSWNCDDYEVFKNDYIPRMNQLYKKLLGREYYPFNTGSFIPSKIGDTMAAINSTKRKFYRGFFPLHKKLAKAIEKEFPSTVELEKEKAAGIVRDEENESVSAIRRLFAIIKRHSDTKNQVLIEYSLNAFVDMHAMQAYLSWLMALDEIDLYSDRQSTIVRLMGIFNGAVVDSKGNIYARIYDGVLSIRETKAPLAAWQLPIGNFGPISLGFPHSEEFSLLVYKDSILPSPIGVQIDRYGPDGLYLGTISKKIAGGHMGMVYSFDMGKKALSKPDGSPVSYKKLKGLDASIAIRDGKLKNTNVSHMSFGTHIDNHGYWEFGMTSGLQKIYLGTLIGINTKSPASMQSFSLGVGTQHCFWGPVMLNAEAYARFVRYTDYYNIGERLFSNDWSFALVPSARFMFSIKPAKRIQFFTALEMSFHILSMNENLFGSGYRNNGFTPWYFTDSFSISPSVQFGFKL